MASVDIQKKVETILKQTLDQGVSFEWTGLSYQQQQAEDRLWFLILLVAVVVYLFLAASYEHLLLPFAVILVTPVSCLAALLGIVFTGGNNNIISDLSLFVVVALSFKNAILIVDFARANENKGLDLYTATLTAAKHRLRPILMTSFAFVLGILPMSIASGAGSELRQIIGDTLLWGMLGVTIMGVYLTPAFYLLVRQIEDKGSNMAAKFFPNRAT